MVECAGVCMAYAQFTVAGVGLTVCVRVDDTSNVRLLRGSVYFVGMSAWGSQRIASLNYPFSTILPYFARVMASR